MRKVVMVTGMQAAGKTTIGRLLAARLNSPAAAFDGDAFYRMVAVGNVNMTPDPKQPSCLGETEHLSAGNAFCTLAMPL